VALVTETIVQPVGATLPELERVRAQPVATPPGRSRHAVAVRAADFVDTRLERFAAGDGPALGRRGGTPAGFDRAFGARPMARLVDRVIKKPLSERLLFGSLKAGGSVRIAVKDDTIVLVEDTPA